MRTFKSLSVRLIFVAAAMLGFQAAQATTLGLTVTHPDLATANADLDYDFTGYCFDTGGSGNSGLCGTTAGKGKTAEDFSGAIDTSLSSGVLTVTGSSMTVEPDNSSFDFIVGGSYTLIANFDGSGSFVDGTVTATGTALDAIANPEFQSGTIVTGDLTAFGFGGTGAGGTFDFTFDNVGGDFLAYYSDYAGIIIQATTFSPASGDWDAGGLDFQADFAATGADVDTFVPVPAAVWLFGSALIGMVGYGRRRRKLELQAQ